MPSCCLLRPLAAALALLPLLPAQASAPAAPPRAASLQPAALPRSQVGLEARLWRLELQLAETEEALRAAPRGRPPLSTGLAIFGFAVTGLSAAVIPLALPGYLRVAPIGGSSPPSSGGSLHAVELAMVTGAGGLLLGLGSLVTGHAISEDRALTVTRLQQQQRRLLAQRTRLEGALPPPAAPAP